MKSRNRNYTVLGKKSRRIVIIMSLHPYTIKPDPGVSFQIPLFIVKVCVKLSLSIHYVCLQINFMYTMSCLKGEFFEEFSEPNMMITISSVFIYFHLFGNNLVH